MGENGGIFGYDNAFFRIVEKAADCFLASIFWCVGCIPIVTAGASTAAFYHTLRKVVRKGEGYVFRTYWHTFKTSMKQGTTLWLLTAALFLLFFYEKELVRENFLSRGLAMGLLYYFFFALEILVIAWAIYIFPYFARFEDTVKTILKNTAVIAIGNLHWTVLLTLLFILMAAAVYIIPVGVFVLPALLFLLYDKIFDRIFGKYTEQEKEEVSADEEELSAEAEKI